jgi:hypothetical protein
MTSEQYAQTLIQRYNSMRSLANDERPETARVFLGAKDSIQEYTLGPQVAQEMRIAYSLAEKELFPTMSS